MMLRKLYRRFVVGAERSGRAVRIALYIVLLLYPPLGRTQNRASLQGWVSDASTGKPLAGVTVEIAGWPLGTLTNDQGYFHITDLADGAYTIHFSASGYRPVAESFSLRGSSRAEFEVALVPVVLHQQESITVGSGPAASLQSARLSDIALSSAEAQQLSTTLLGDPLQAVHWLPGAASNNDFESRFSVQGAAFRRVGVYLDGVLLRNPFHTIRGVSGVSLTAFDNDLFDAITLDTGLPALNSSDRTAGILGLHTREGSDRRLTFKGSTSLTSSTVTMEGPLGRNRRGSWLASIRKGFPGYILRHTSSSPKIVAGFTDFQGKLSYNLNLQHHLSVILMHDSSSLDSAVAAGDGSETLLAGDFNFRLIHLAWRYAPNEHWMITNRGAFFQERGNSLYFDGLARSRDIYSEWVWSSDGTRVWANSNTLQFGLLLRRMREDGLVPLVDLRTSSPLRDWLRSLLPRTFLDLFHFGSGGPQQLNTFQGSLLHGGGYLQHSWSAAENRVLLTAGLRWDRLNVSPSQAVSPQVSLALAAGASMRFHISWGRSAQFPNLQELFSSVGSTTLLPERATHFEVGFERYFTQGFQLRVSSYRRWDRDLLFRPFGDPRILAGRVFAPSLTAPIHNSARGRSQGIQIMLEKRSSRGLNGWVSYTLGKTDWQDSEAGISFPSDWDQRHSVSGAANYRLRPSLLLSGKWTYASGMPIAGFYRREANQVFLSESRNALRLGRYQRLDLRLDKQFAFDRWSLTLFGEIINVTNRRNQAAHQFNKFNPSTGAVRFSTFNLFPMLPSGGVKLQF